MFFRNFRTPKPMVRNPVKVRSYSEWYDVAGGNSNIIFCAPQSLGCQDPISNFLVFQKNPPSNQTIGCGLFIDSNQQKSQWPPELVGMIWLSCWEHHNISFEFSISVVIKSMKRRQSQWFWSWDLGGRWDYTDYTDPKNVSHSETLLFFSSAPWKWSPALGGKYNYVPGSKVRIFWMVLQALQWPYSNRKSLWVYFHPYGIGLMSLFSKTIHSLKKKANAPENRPRLKRKGSSCNYWFSGAMSCEFQGPGYI